MLRASPDKACWRRPSVRAVAASAPPVDLVAVVRQVALRRTGRIAAARALAAVVLASPADPISFVTVTLIGVTVRRGGVLNLGSRLADAAGIPTGMRPLRGRPLKIN